MKKIISLIFCIAIVLSSCSRSDVKYYDSEYFVMDTNFVVRLSTDGMTSDELININSDVNSQMIGIEKILSKTDDSSELTLFNKSGGGIDGASGVLFSVVSEALRISEYTHGSYDPSLGLLTDLWNTGDAVVPSDDFVSDALSHSGYDKLVIKEDSASILKTDSRLMLDLGGIGKGYAVDKAIEYLRTTDVKYGLCSFSSTIGVFGAKPDGDRFRITVCDPKDTSMSVAAFNIAEGFISSSGDYEKYFESDGIRYHHITDPETGYPASSGLRGVTVYAGNASVADALSTAFFVMGADKTMAFYSEGKINFEAVLITDDKIYLTDGLKTGDILEITTDNYEIIK